MGKARGVKLSSGSKRSASSLGISTRSGGNGKQRASIDAGKKRGLEKKNTGMEHSQVQLIASILMKKHSSSPLEATSKLVVKAEHSRSSARRLGEKAAKRTSHPKKTSGIPRNGVGIVRLLRSRVSKKTDQPASEASVARKKRRRHNKRKHASDKKHDHVVRIRQRIRYLLNKIRMEQNLIDAYTGEGWKGQSREKIRPEKELLRAETQILHCKIGIREAVNELETLAREGCLLDALFDPQGRIHHDNIFCAKCQTQEALPENDIILCDGICNRAFHQKCLDPPLKTEDIPPEDEGWLCPVCKCKSDCLDIVNVYLGTSYRIEDSWEEVFAKEATAALSGDRKTFGFGEDFPSDDSDDDDYNPDGDGVSRTKNGSLQHEVPSDSNGSNTSSDNDGSPNSSDGDFEVTFFDEFAESKKGDREKADTRDRVIDVGAHVFVSEDDDALFVEGKRQREEVDYKKLNDEMFGNTNLEEDVSNDDEWVPTRIRRKAKERITFGHGTTTEVNMNKNLDTKSSTLDAEHGGGTSKLLRTKTRLPSHIVEKLRITFSENQLPSKAFKEDVSKKLGVSYQKVNIWFRNARYAALKTQKCSPDKQGRHAPRIHEDNIHDPLKEHGPNSKANIVNRFQLQRRKHKRTMNGFAKPVNNDCIAEHEQPGVLEDIEKLNKVQMKIDELRQTLRNRKPQVNAHGDLLVYIAVPELREKTRPPLGVYS